MKKDNHTKLRTEGTSSAAVSTAEIYDLIPGMVIVMDTNHTILDLNEVAAKTAGKPKTGCIGAKFWDLYDSPACRAGTCPAAEAARTGKVCDGEAFPQIHGKEVPVLVTAAPRFDDAGRVVGIVEIVLPAAGEVGMGREVERLALAAQAGELKRPRRRGSFPWAPSSKTKSVNKMLDDILLWPLTMFTEVMDTLGKGEVPAPIATDCKGDFCKLKTSVNACLKGFGGLVEANQVLQRMAVNDYSTSVAGSYGPALCRNGHRDQTTRKTE